MTEKKRPLGICDLCEGLIHQKEWYTSKGNPRLYCSRDCMNAANSRKGAPIRSAKQIEHIKNGEWRNPAKIRPPTSEEQSARSRKGRLREVAEGRWRNPALTPEAREKLSKPRKHTGALASAIEKLHIMHMSELTEEEQEAFRSYSRSLWRQGSDSETVREKRRARWRENYRKKLK